MLWVSMFFFPISIWSSLISNNNESKRWLEWKSNQNQESEYEQVVLQYMINSRNMLTKRLSQSAAHAANKPEWHKTAFRTIIIQIWSCTENVLKPVPAVAEHKPLCLLKHPEIQPRQRAGETNTHGEDFLRLPTRSHVGVVDLFEDHPGFIVLPHLTGGKAKEREDKLNSCDHHQSRLLKDGNRLPSTVIYTIHKHTPLIPPRWAKIMRVTTTVTHFTSKGNYPAAANLLALILRLLFRIYGLLQEFWMTHTVWSD